MKEGEKVLRGTEPTDFSIMKGEIGNEHCERKDKTNRERINA